MTGSIVSPPSNALIYKETDAGMQVGLDRLTFHYLAVQEKRVRLKFTEQHRLL